MKTHVSSDSHMMSYLEEKQTVLTVPWHWVLKPERRGKSTEWQKKNKNKHVWVGENGAAPKILQKKIRKALTCNHSLLVVIHTSPIVNRAKHLITVLDHSGIEGFGDNQPTGAAEAGNGVSTIRVLACLPPSRFQQIGIPCIPYTTSMCNQAWKPTSAPGRASCQFLMLPPFHLALWKAR